MVRDRDRERDRERDRQTDRQTDKGGEIDRERNREKHVTQGYHCRQVDKGIQRPSTPQPPHTSISTTFFSTPTDRQTNRLMDGLTDKASHRVRS